MRLRELRNYIIEFTGSFLIVVFTCLSYAGFEEKKINLIQLALINGFVISVCAWTGMAISQSHFNPVITITQLLNRKMDFKKAFLYIAIQLFGSIFAALVVVLLSPVDSSNQIIISFPFPSHQMLDYQIFVIEFIFSFFYVAMYFSLVLNTKAPSNVFGFGIGGVQSIAILSVETFSGACLNPLRFFGPAMLTEKAKYLSVYFTSQLCGGILAGLYYEFYLNSQKKQ